MVQKSVNSRKTIAERFQIRTRGDRGFVHVFTSATLRKAGTKLLVMIFRPVRGVLPDAINWPHARTIPV